MKGTQNGQTDEQMVRQAHYLNLDLPVITTTINEGEGD